MEQKFVLSKIKDLMLPRLSQIQQLYKVHTYIEATPIKDRSSLVTADQLESEVIANGRGGRTFSTYICLFGIISVVSDEPFGPRIPGRIVGTTLDVHRFVINTLAPRHVDGSF